MPASLTVKTAIGYALKYFEGLPPDDLANVRNRFQLLLLLQGVVSELEQRNMKFMMVESAVTIPAGEFSIEIPDNFKEIGEEGSVWYIAQNRELSGPKQRQEILSRRHSDGNSAKEPFEYSIWGGMVQTVKVGTDTSLLLNYIRTTQNLTDASNIAEDGADDSSVLEIPAQYHFDVVLPGLLSRCADVKAELRNKQEKIYLVNRAEMYKRERFGRGGIEIFPEYEGIQT